MGGLPRTQPELQTVALMKARVGTIVKIDGRRALVVDQGVVEPAGTFFEYQRTCIAWLDDDGVPCAREVLFDDRRKVTVLPDKPPLTLWDPDAPRKNAAQERAVKAMIAANGGRE